MKLALALLISILGIFLVKRSYQGYHYKPKHYSKDHHKHWGNSKKNDHGWKHHDSWKDGKHGWKDWHKHNYHGDNHKKHGHHDKGHKHGHHSYGKKWGNGNEDWGGYGDQYGDKNKHWANDKWSGKHHNKDGWWNNHDKGWDSGHWKQYH